MLNSWAIWAWYLVRNRSLLTWAPAGEISPVRKERQVAFTSHLSIH